ncbi:MAG: type II toxin-antitoxin system HicB family antitoxin, partial [Microcystis panniformis]|jgi:antitoxin HicB
MFYKLPLLLIPQPEGGFTVTCPLLPELITEADSLEEVLENAKDAFEAVLETYQDLGKKLPVNLQAFNQESPALVEAIISA